MLNEGCPLWSLDKSVEDTFTVLTGLGGRQKNSVFREDVSIRGEGGGEGDSTPLPLKKVNFFRQNVKYTQHGLKSLFFIKTLFSILPPLSRYRFWRNIYKKREKKGKFFLFLSPLEAKNSIDKS